MAKLMDIKCYWNVFDDHIFNDSNMWEGKIILNDDGWFEGIVFDKHASYTGGIFVFGVYHLGKVIHLFKLQPSNPEIPILFHGKKDKNGYNGEFRAIDIYEQSVYGVSRIITQSAEQVRDNTYQEMQKLYSSIEECKNNCIDIIGKLFYDSYLEVRNSLCKIVLKDYEGKEFTDDEIQRFIEEYELDNEGVDKPTVEEVKVLANTMIDSTPNKKANLPF